MTTLRDRLTDETTQARCAKACSELVHEELAARKGLSGAALKTAVGLMQKVRPTLVPDAMSRLIPHFADALEPWWVASNEDGQGFAKGLQADPPGVANALLAVTDAKIEGAHEGLRRGYAKLRKGAQAQVEQSVPGIARTLGDVLSA